MANFKQTNHKIYGNQYNAAHDISIQRIDPNVPDQIETQFDVGSEQVSSRSPSQIHSVFLSYSSEDAQLLNHLKTHLAPLQRAKLINTWYDRDIKAGADRQKEIDTHLMQSDLILLLVSPDFMASDYCYGFEMQEALKRHAQNKACVIPIILRPVYWKNAPFSILQVLPRNAEPIVSPKHSSIDEAFLQVIIDIRYIIDDFDAS